MEQYREAGAKKSSLVAGIDPVPEKTAGRQEDLLYDPAQEATVEEDPIVDDRLKELERLLPKSAEDQLDAARKIISEAGTLIPRFTADLFFANPAMFTVLREKIQAKLTGAEAALVVVLAKADSDYAKIPFFRRWIFYVLALFGRIHEATIVSLMSRDGKRKTLHEAVDELQELAQRLQSTLIAVDRKVEKLQLDSVKPFVKKVLANNAEYQSLARIAEDMRADLITLDNIDGWRQWEIVKSLYKKWFKQGIDKDIFLDYSAVTRIHGSVRKFVFAQLNDIKGKMQEMEEAAAAQTATGDDSGIGTT